MTKCTVSGLPPENPENASAPTNETRPDGQLKDHWVLCQKERDKGFVRPYRDSYVHVGRPGPRYPLADLTKEQQESYGSYGYVKYEKYPEGGESSAIGRFWTQAELDKIDKGCGVRTIMPHACAETYAREPGFYGSTFCCGCGKYLPVGRDGEFVWDGTDERVGT